jgi:hypothetical protein
MEHGNFPGLKSYIKDDLKEIAGSTRLCQPTNLVSRRLNLIKVGPGNEARLTGSYLSFFHNDLRPSEKIILECSSETS